MERSNTLMTMADLKQDLNLREERIFSPLAAYSAHALRRHPEDKARPGYRQAYALDGGSHHAFKGICTLYR
jgi:hypothetical protein